MSKPGVPPLSPETILLALEHGEMLRGFLVMPFAFTMAEAAEASRHSIDTLTRAADRGELVKRYANSKPIILPDELYRWLRTLPKTRPK